MSKNCAGGLRQVAQGHQGSIALAQAQAVRALNAELIQLYWDIGRMIESLQQ